MEKLEAFKQFVKANPRLLKYVKNNEMTWQKFYEIYDLYGTTDSIWDEYLKDDTKAQTNSKGLLNGISLGEITNFFKNIDLDSVQNGIGNIQRVLGVVQDFGSKEKTPEIKPRPLYKHFED